MTDSASRQAAPRHRTPEFAPVPVRARRDGWTAERQREFIRRLHVSRNVGKAAKATGMSRRSAYRLRERPDAESFAAAWDAAFGPRRASAVTNMSQLWYRALFKTKPIIRGGKQVGTITSPDNDAALKLYDRLERRIAGHERWKARRRGRSQ